MTLDPTDFVEEENLERHRRERAERGYSWWDWINFDVYISAVIANAVQDMKDHGHTMFSYPESPESEWPALTDAEYDVMIKGFGDYAENAYDHDHNVDNNLIAALEVFKKRFRSLWD